MAQPLDRPRHRSGASSAPREDLADPIAAAIATDGGARAAAHPDDLRRTGGAILSAIIPGLGQLANGRWRPAALFFLPVAAVAIVAAGILRAAQPAKLLAWVVDPSVLHALMGASLVILAIRMLAALHAFFDRRYASRPGLAALAFLALSLGSVAAPHALVQWYGAAADQAFGRFFSGSSAQASATFIPPRDDERLNVLIVGIDKTAERTATLTDTMMLVSLDRRTGSASIVSIPRDLVDVPLGNGSTFAPKLNSLYGFADRHPDQFPKGGLRALEDAVGALLGVRVHAYAELDFSAFVRVVDLAGGVEVHVARAIDDPDYPGYAGGPRGFAISEGDHHLDGITALAYARSRKGLGDSDFTRAARK
jgi:LCP family protein required for cell wall assembly